MNAISADEPVLVRGVKQNLEFRSSLAAEYRYPNKESMFDILVRTAKSGVVKNINIILMRCRSNEYRTQERYTVAETTFGIQQQEHDHEMRERKMGKHTDKRSYKT